MRILSLFAATVVSMGTLAATDTGIVNFANCVTGSKHGKKEQSNFENIRKQMAGLIENTEKELRDLTSKLEDTEFLDSLSPKAEEELKAKYQALNEDLARYQHQFYQVLNHANSQLIQKMIQTIGKASKKIAEEKSLAFIINEEACFYSNPSLNITNNVIAEMDRVYDTELKSKKISDNDDGESVEDQVAELSAFQDAMNFPFSAPVADNAEVAPAE